MILVLVIGGMTPMAALQLRRVRTAFGLEKPRGDEGAVVPDPAAAQRELERWSPLPAAVLGGIGLLAVLWLMMFKPF